MPPASAYFQFHKKLPYYSHERFLIHYFLLQSYTGVLFFLYKGLFLKKLPAPGVCLIVWLQNRSWPLPQVYSNSPLMDRSYIFQHQNNR